MTKQEFIIKYVGKAVWCKTEELANEFLALADSFGYEWINKNKLTIDNSWQRYKENTCYYYRNSQLFVDSGFVYCYKNHFIVDNIEIIEFKTLVVKLDLEFFDTQISASNKKKLIEYVDMGYRYLAKDNNGEIYVYSDKPFKDFGYRIAPSPKEIDYIRSIEFIGIDTDTIYDITALKIYPYPSISDIEDSIRYAIPTLSFDLGIDLAKNIRGVLIPTPTRPNDLKSKINLVYINEKKKQIGIKWKDGTTTKSTCSKKDNFDINVGFAIAFARKIFKNDKTLTKFIESKTPKNNKKGV